MDFRKIGSEDRKRLEFLRSFGTSNVQPHAPAGAVLV
jgi:hypothetical protein